MECVRAYTGVEIEVKRFIRRRTQKISKCEPSLRTIRGSPEVTRFRERAGAHEFIVCMRDGYDSDWKSAAAT